VRDVNPLNADLHALSKDDVAFFEKRYGVDAIEHNIRRTAARYALPIVGPDGASRGWITRRPYDGSPADTEANRRDPQWSTKALTYLETDDPCLSWYHTGKAKTHGAYLVEDQLSAMRLLKFLTTNGKPARVVALLGTGLNAAKVAEIQRIARGSPVSICLDKDATGHAFALARKWGQAFSTCRVIVLSKDIKDSTDSELVDLPL
jgi:hypothetical protein